MLGLVNSSSKSVQVEPLATIFSTTYDGNSFLVYLIPDPQLKLIRSAIQRNQVTGSEEFQKQIAERTGATYFCERSGKTPKNVLKINLTPLLFVNPCGDLRRESNAFYLIVSAASVEGLLPGEAPM